MNAYWQTILSISGIILTIFFGILSYVFYRKGIKKKKLSITSNSTILVSKDLSNYNGLQISYNNEEIKTLTNTSITIRNIGNDVIEDNDITPSDPIIISTTNKFLSTNGEEYKVTSSNKKVSTSVQKIDDSKLQLSFDFLNPNNELSITLLHNGKISVNGDLKNGYVDKVSNNDLKNEYVDKVSINDKYVPISKNVYFNHNDTEEFSYSSFTVRMLYLLSLIMLFIIVMFELTIGKDFNDHFISLLFPVIILMMLQIKR